MLYTTTYICYIRGYLQQGRVSFRFGSFQRFNVNIIRVTCVQIVANCLLRFANKCIFHSLVQKHVAVAILIY
jgi:hypothetical protein